MKSALLLVVSAAVASAQLVVTGSTYYCTKPNAAYCAGDSLGTNIIVRCDGTVGAPANCNDNLDGEPPQGLSYAPCWQSSLTAGDAACSKNGIVYGNNGTFTLSTSTASAALSTGVVAVTSMTPGGPFSTATILLSTGVVAIPSGTNPGGRFSTVTGMPSSGVPVPSSNGTSPGSGSSATATPVGPTTTGLAPSSTFTGAASLKSASVALAAGGIFVAYFL